MNDMTVSAMGIFIRDNFGRRSGVERRLTRLQYVGDEVRKGRERRQGSDRRSPFDRRILSDRRSGATESPGMFWFSTNPDPLSSPLENPFCVIGPNRRSSQQRRSGIDRRDFLIV